ncbi:MAG: DUF1800 domain-containing protein [Acidobacteria bacterium]|nr:DUF1800 domain-containing protein [Acidobacteriota bacterium]
MLRQCIAVAVAASLLPAAAPAKLNKDQRALHAASRLTFGPTAADLAAIRKMGVDKWVDQQLHPERIPENPELVERLKQYDSLTMTNAQLIEKYPPPQLLRSKKQAAAADQAKQKEMRQAPVQMIYRELSEAKLLRALHSTHQLEELLTDFWFNHFNVFFDKGFDRVLVTSYERDAIRPYVLGNFKDMLLATAEHPAMLFYLDNWTSVSTEQLEQMRKRFQGRKKQQLPAGKRATGLNENYARELLELHTMGVDNGYTQKDVTEVARCFTGWSIADIREDAQFKFNALLHDPKEKLVLGHVIPAGRGVEDGLQVIDILVNHPSTAKFISTKLAQRFVADAPPTELVAKMAAAFTKTHGDLREVMRTMLRSPEFWSAGAYKVKMKMPLEMVASALRATGARVENAAVVQQQLRTLGQPLYRKVEPTGYYPFAEEWTNSASLLTRMNFGLELTQNKVRGVRVDLDKVLSGKSAPAEIAQVLLLHPPAAETLKTLAGSKDTRPAHVAGLVLGGPEFQRR